MSIGKFFILAILLPMATIYLTLTLKGQKHQIFNNDVENQPQHLNLMNFSSENDATAKELQKTYQYNDDGELIEAEELTSNSEHVGETEKSGSEQTFESIEEIIQFKKNNINANKIVELRDGEKITADDENFAKTTRNVVIINNISTNTTSSQVTKTNKEVISNNINSRNINSGKTKPRSTKTRNTKPRTSKKRVAKTNASAIAKIKPKSQTRRHAKPSKTTFVTKKPAKKTVFRKTRPIRKAPKIVQVVETDQYESVFDEDNILDDEGNIASTETTVTSVVTSIEEITDEEPAEKPERFSSDPCSGRSARYIARCRK